LKTALVTLNLDLIAQMSRHPAVGGIAKGYLVRERAGGSVSGWAERTRSGSGSGPGADEVNPEERGSHA
jgi:hypothetical protein